jgi:hypothetical protein
MEYIFLIAGGSFMKADMLVKLYDLRPYIEGIEDLECRGISFKRALPAFLGR